MINRLMKIIAIKCSSQIVSNRLSRCSVQQAETISPTVADANHHYTNSTLPALKNF